jgi:hypothetical protein
VAGTAHPEYPRRMRRAVRSTRYWLPLLGALACLIVAGMVGPLVTFLLIVVAFALLGDVATALFASATGSGGLPDHKQ